MMKERYETPVMLIAHFAAEDVITASNELPVLPVNGWGTYDAE